jgi:hypothetical protein
VGATLRDHAFMIAVVVCVAMNGLPAQRARHGGAAALCRGFLRTRVSTLPSSLGGALVPPVGVEPTLDGF